MLVTMLWGVWNISCLFKCTGILQAKHFRTKLSTPLSWTKWIFHWPKLYKRCFVECLKGFQIMGTVTGFTCEADQEWEPKQRVLCHR